MLFTDLETDRLLLKNISLKDAGFLYEQFSNDFVNKYLFDYDPLSSIDEAIDLIKFYSVPEPRNQHRWILVLKDEGIKIGTIGYHSWDHECRKAEIGYDLKEEYTGYGYMSEALNMVLSFGRNCMKIEELCAVIYVENLASIKIAERNGFHQTGTRYDTFHDQQYLHYLYKLKLKEWKQ
ncbi:MAG TPA: GNAT family N-acetyltransferase [Candidatus Cloacimonadota bacterium]|nr:GNAT family N-acetyltransferase [Candidatus Cloacimonadota bacterium]